MNIELKQTFERIANNNEWGSAESVSGTGSTLDATEKLRAFLTKTLEYNDGIKSILDAPCGDVNWMRTLFPMFEEQNILYKGMDIVSSIIASNVEKTSAYSNISFIEGDITTTPLPKVDMIIMRDILGHLSTDNVFKVLENVKRSGSKWLFTTTFPNVINVEANEDGGWRLINLLSFPYQFNPEVLMNEHCKEENGAYDNKCMALFNVSKLPLEV
jgi:hypothetical protein